MARIEVTLEPVKTMYVEAKGGLSGVGTAWSKLDSNLPSLKGRKMYGAYYDQDKVYRARYCDILSIDLLFIVVLRQGEMVF